MYDFEECLLFFVSSVLIRFALFYNRCQYISVDNSKSFMPNTPDLSVCAEKKQYTFDGYHKCPLYVLCLGLFPVGLNGVQITSDQYNLTHYQ